MSEALAYLIASIEASVAWAGATAFIVLYGVTSPWRASFPGRTMMYLCTSLWLLLTLALTARWIEPAPIVFQLLALTIYGVLALTILRLLLLLVLVKTKRITPANQNPRLLRDWWSNRGTPKKRKV